MLYEFFEVDIMIGIISFWALGRFWYR